jgi:transcriptional regulator with GAF, ATPase, and Fis domain
MQVDEKEFFIQATLKICSSLEIEKALHQYFLYVCKFLPVNQMGFHVYHRNAGIVETVALADIKSGKILSMKIQLSAKGRKQVEKQRSIRVRVIDCLGDDPVAGPVAAKLGASGLSAIVMDLVLERRMLGVFSIFNNGKEKFTQKHINLLTPLSKPCAIALTNSLRYRELKKLKDILTDDNKYLRDELRKISGEDVIGADQGLKSVMEMVHQVSPLESPVLLLGETGTGKEVIANAIHNSSLRREGPFIRVNCGAIPATLLDSELFGYEKGAFTGAVSQKRGRIERAHGGTLFLDEVGELTPEAQIRLLRVLQEKEIDRIGGSQTIRVNIRIIAATHKNLEKMMEQKKFRADLFFRLRVFPIEIPPLKKRREDIPALVHHFIKNKSKEMKRVDIPVPAPGTMARLMAYHWPGNIRELENAVERSLILDRKNFIFFTDIVAGQNDQIKPARYSARKAPVKSLELDKVMTNHIQFVLNNCNGRVEGAKGAARVLNIHPSTLRKRMKKLHIPFGRDVKP